MCLGLTVRPSPCPVFIQGHVVMGNNAVSPYQQVIEKTKSLSFRSQMLAMNIEKKMAHASRNEVSELSPLPTLQSLVKD